MFQNISTSGMLRVPDQKDARLAAFDPRPRQIEQWINGLPRADIGEMARLVYKGLFELNRIRIPDSDRYRIAELFREPVRFLSMSLKKHYIGLPLPLPRKKHKIALLARELQSEMAIAYKILIENKLADGMSRSDTKQLTVAVYSAIYYLSQVLLRCYQIYIPPPHNTWKEIHSLYMYAQESNLHRTIVKNPTAESQADSTISELYKQIVLLSLAGPYRLRQSEIETLYNMLVRWEQYADVQEITDPEQQTGMCSLNLNSDEPPGYLTLCSDTNIGFCRVLDTSALIDVIGQNIATGTPVDGLGVLGKANKLSVDVLRRLVLTWGGMAKRNFSRTAKNSKVLVTLGLDAVHHFIRDALLQESGARVDRIQEPTKKNDAPAETKSAMNLDLVPIDDSNGQNIVGAHVATKPRFTSTPVYGIGNPNRQKKDSWNPLLRLNTPDYDRTPSEPANGGVDDATASETTFEFHICTALNESAGGFCLVWMPVEGSDGSIFNALVGELIGMQEIDESNKSRWSVGVVRWMKSRDGKQLELGIQKLAPYAITAAVRQQQGKKNKESQRALVLPEIKNINQPVTIAVPNVYDVGDTVVLSMENETKTVRLTKLLETTGAFAHFQYKEQKKPERPRDTDNDDSKWNFDNIWSSI